MSGTAASDPAAGRAKRTAFGRRRFLAFLVAAPTLTVAARLGSDLASPQSGHAQVPSPPNVSDVADINDALTLAALPTSHMLVLEVGQDGRIRLWLPRVEKGQGITTAVAMMVAEELDANLADVEVSLSDARPELVFNQLTAGSNSVHSLYEPVRQAAALARARMAAAAADRWGIDADAITVSASTVAAPDGRTATFAELSEAAADGSLVSGPGTPKDTADHSLLGTATPRIDARDQVTGAATYALDLDVAGAKPTIVARPPTLYGTVESVDTSEARAMPGVIDVAQIPTGVAIMAETFGEAIDAKDALDVAWGAGPVDGLSDGDIGSRLRSATLPHVVPPLGSTTVDGEFDFAFVSHATMEVMCAVADVRDDSARIWFGSQAPIAAQEEIARELGLAQEEVTFHVTRAGGGFGKKYFFETPLEAARISRAMGRPVKLMWTRQDDTRHSYMRPATHQSVRATIAGGEVVAFEQRIASEKTSFRPGLGEPVTATVGEVSNEGYSQGIFRLLVGIPYNFGAVTQVLSEIDLGTPSGPWRSIYSGTAQASAEIMVDEIADALGRDPVEFRRSVLKGDRGRAVLDKVAEEGEWGREMPPGHAQGVAYLEEFKSCTAYLVEIDARAPDAPRVARAVIAADVGKAINPSGVEAQLQGCLIDGISTILYAGLHIDNGAVRESSYGDFRYARQAQAPREVRTFLLDSGDEPGGVGELGVPAAAGAVANAYARATGTRPHQFPINF